MTIDDDIARIDAALAAGPTPGPWHQDPQNPYFIARGSAPHSYLVAVAPPTNSGGSQSGIDAAYVAACHPEAIRRIIAAYRAAKCQQEREHAAKDTQVLWNGWQPMVLKGNPPMWVYCSLAEYKAAGPMNRRLVPAPE